MYELDILIECSLNYLLTNEYSKHTITHHKTSWNRLRRWCKEQGLREYDSSIQQRYFDNTSLSTATLTKRKGEERGHVVRLLEIAKYGKPIKRESPRKYSVPNGFAESYLSYENSLVDQGLKSSTIKGMLSTIRHFCSACGANSPQQLTVSSLSIFAQSLSAYAPQTRAQKLYITRSFATFLAKSGECEPEVALSMPCIPGHRHSSIPSAYAS